MATKQEMQELVQVAADMNRVMKLKPVIDTKGSADKLRADIAEEAGQVEPEDQEHFKPSTWEYLRQNNLLVHLDIHPDQEPKPEEKPKAAPTKKEAAKPAAKPAPAAKKETEKPDAKDKKASPAAEPAAAKKEAKKPAPATKAAPAKKEAAKPAKKEKVKKVGVVEFTVAQVKKATAKKPATLESIVAALAPLRPDKEEHTLKSGVNGVLCVVKHLAEGDCKKGYYLPA